MTAIETEKAVCDHLRCPGCEACNCHREKTAPPAVKKPQPSKRLERRNAEQWTLLRGDVERVLRMFERRSDELNERARAAWPDGFPAGGDGSRSGETTDSTLSAVLKREQAVAANAAVRAIRTFNLAISTLDAAERHCKDAFPPEKAAVDPIGWCRNCATIRWNSVTDTSKKFAQPNPRCSWCSSWYREHGFEAPAWLLRRRARGERIYDVDEQKAIVEHAAETANAEPPRA